MLAFLRPSWLSRWTHPVFRETPNLRDEELELIPPSKRWLDAMMSSIDHPQTRRIASELSRTSRDQVRDFLSSCPGGNQGPAAGVAGLPAHHFWMFDHDSPQLPIAGGIALRLGNAQEIELYYGHFGYHVFPPHRGRHFAERAVRLLLPLARRHALNPLWITCNPDNWASLRTCQRLGATLVQTVLVPPDHLLYQCGEIAKCRFRLDASTSAAAQP